MKTTALLLLSLAALTARADDKPLLAVPGKVILEAKLDGAPGAPWKAAKGKWEAADGTMRGSELVEEHPQRDRAGEGARTAVGHGAPPKP